MTRGLVWNSLHIYYYDDDKDDLLLDCVRPLLRNLSANAEKAFFVRHWLRGPHLRLNFFAPDELFSVSIEPPVRERVGRYLSERPSKAELDTDRLRAVHRALAYREQEHGLLFPLYPNNTIWRVPYDRRLHVLGSEAAAELLEDFYFETNELVFQMLDHARNHENRQVLCLNLMLAIAHRMGLHISRGFISYRSHAEGFIMNTSACDL